MTSAYPPCVVVVVLLLLLLLANQGGDAMSKSMPLSGLGGELVSLDCVWQVLLRLQGLSNSKDCCLIPGEAR